MIQSNPYFTVPFTTGNAGYDRAILVIALLLVALGLKLLADRVALRHRSRSRWTPDPARLTQRHVRHELDRPASVAASMANPLDQMVAVSAVPFETVPLLNQEESRLLPILEGIVRNHGDGHRVMAQTSLGELIRPVQNLATTGIRSAAFASINSKRLDFAIINRLGHLVIAIEYHGSGHYRSNSFMRDAVKREAVRKAGVPYLEVQKDFVPDDVIRQVKAILVPTRPARQT